MNNCVIYYKEISSTVSASDCTFSFQKNLQLHIEKEKQEFLKNCLYKCGISDGNYKIKSDSNGKPYLVSHPELYFNLSHTTAHLNESILGCIVIGLSAGNIGVDAEYLREIKPSLAKKICSPQEYHIYETCDDSQEFLIRLWTIKEAYLKYTGEGLRRSLNEFNFHCLESNHNISTFALTNHPEITVYQFHLPNNLWISVCVESGANAPVPTLVSC